jgi:hypothetical protein
MYYTRGFIVKIGPSRTHTGSSGKNPHASTGLNIERFCKQ